MNGRQSSIFSASSLNLPTAYHEKTTQYENDDDYFDSMNAFEENDEEDFTEVIEAINPNVKVKSSNYKFKIFKTFLL